MRLTCPRCNAQYEIPDSVIPTAGREVECSSCGHVWHQPGRSLRENPADSADKPGDYDPQARPELNQPLHDSILSILREETARELSARKDGGARDASAQDHIPATRSDVERPPSNGQDFDWPVATVIMPGDPLPADAPPAVDLPADAPAPPAPTAAPRLPDAAELAATLTRATPAPLRPATTEHAVPVETLTHPEPDRTPPRNLPAIFQPPPPRRGRYAMGFGLAVMLALSVVAFYALAPRIAPDAAWRAGLDHGRVWLAEQFGALQALIF